MSVRGAMALGGLAGGYVIKYAKSHYDKKISELQGYAAKLDSHLSTLQSYKSEIPGFWGDTTGEDYVKVIDSQIQQLTVARQRIDDLSNMYDAIKDAMDTAKNTVDEKVDEISAIIGGLTGLSE